MCETAEVFRSSLKDEDGLYENIETAVASLDPDVENFTRRGQARVLQCQYEQSEGEEHADAEERSIMESASAEDDGSPCGGQTNHAEEGVSRDEACGRVSLGFFDEGHELAFWDTIVRSQRPAAGRAGRISDSGEVCGGGTVAPQSSRLPKLSRYAGTIPLRQTQVRHHVSLEVLFAPLFSLFHRAEPHQQRR
jgi:hypothetical protein